MRDDKVNHKKHKKREAIIVEVTAWLIISGIVYIFTKALV
jgi:hypothetical protein